jgi:hypothetical protein
VIRTVYTDTVGYEWLPIALARLRGVEPHEVMQALAAETRWPRPVAGPGGVALITIWARTRVGRRLIVVVRKSGPFDAWIIGARDMNAAEAAEYDRWESER